VAGVGVIAKGRGTALMVPEGTVAEIVRVTQQELPPDGATQWSTRSLAKRAGVGKDKVARVWRDHQLKPWKVEPSQDFQRPALRRKAGRRGGAVHGPAQAGRAVSFDEQDQVQALDRTQPSLPLRPGGRAR